MGVFPGLSIGASSMENASNALQIVGHNIANLSTPGFKRSRPMQSTAFSSFLTGGLPGNQLGNGAHAVQSQRVVTQGSNERTGIDTDIAIDGKGWFSLRDPNDPAGELFYTRAGNFRPDENLFLVNLDGLRVQGYAITGGVVGTTLTDISVTSPDSLGTPTSLVQPKGTLSASASVLGTPPAVTSAAKRDEFTVVLGVNDQIAFQMNQGGPVLTASLVTDGGLVSGTPVTGAGVAAALKAALEAQNGVADTYTVDYDQATDHFRITSFANNANTITFLHDDAASTASALMGFAAAPSEVIGPDDSETSDVGVAFNVLAGVNDTLNVLIDGAASNVTVAAGNYTGQGLAYAIEAALRSASSLNVGVQVTYSPLASPDQFIIKGPRTGEAYTLAVPSTGGTVAFLGTTLSVAGGTLGATTGLSSGTAVDGTGYFDIADPVATSSANMTVDLVDGLGVRHPFTLYFRKVADNAWEWHGALKGERLVGSTASDAMEEVVSGLLRFDGDGKLVSEATTVGTGVFNFDQIGGDPLLPPVLPPAGQLIDFDFGDSILTDAGTGLTGMVQFDNASFSSAPGGQNQNVLSLTTADTDGVPAGSFLGFRIGHDGLVSAFFSNGDTVDLALLTLTLFPAQDELEALGKNLYRAGAAAGLPVVAAPQTEGAGLLLTESLERSNVEVAEQFGELIFQQQVFQANSRVITTSDKALETLINLV